MDHNLFVMARLCEAVETGMDYVDNCEIYHLSSASDGSSMQIKVSQDLIDSQGNCSGMAYHTVILEVSSVETEVTEWPEDSQISSICDCGE